MVQIMGADQNIRDTLDACGEVLSPNKINDLGLAELLTLLWQDISRYLYILIGLQNEIIYPLIPLSLL